MRPTATTAVDIVILTINSMATWLERHQPLLAIYLPESLDEPDEVRAIAKTLELTSGGYTREQREDVAATAQRDAAITHGQRVIRGVRAVAEQRVSAPQLKDFADSAPSRLIYTPTIRKGLRRSRLGVTAHQGALDADGKERSAHLLKQIDEAVSQLDKASEDEVREEQETRAARRAFERAHEAAMGAIDELHAAAEAALIDDEAPLRDLEELYVTASNKPQ